MPTSCFLLLFSFFVFLHFRLTLPLEERAWGQLREGCWRGGVWPRVLYERRRLLSANNLQSRDDDEEPRRLEGEGAGSRRKRVRGWMGSSQGGRGGFRGAGTAESCLFLCGNLAGASMTLTANDSRLAAHCFGLCSSRLTPHDSTSHGSIITTHRSRLAAHWLQLAAHDSDVLVGWLTGWPGSHGGQGHSQRR